MNKCYLCGATDKRLTDDHIPPKGFFPKPRPKNLIVVRCCVDCHAPLSLQDEAFRAWVSSVHGASPAGKWIFQNKVVASSFARSPKLRENMKRHLRTLQLKSMGHTIEAPALCIPEERANIFLKRLTKGLLTHFYPEYDYGNDQFIIQVRAPIREHLEQLQAFSKNCVRDSRGDGVFDFWRALVPDYAGGLWIYLFYQEVCFVVCHSSKWLDKPPARAKFG